MIEWTDEHLKFFIDFFWVSMCKHSYEDNLLEFIVKTDPKDLPSFIKKLIEIDANNLGNNTSKAEKEDQKQWWNQFIDEEIIPEFGEDIGTQVRNE